MASRISKNDERGDDTLFQRLVKQVTEEPTVTLPPFNFPAPLQGLLIRTPVNLNASQVTCQRVSGSLCGPRSDAFVCCTGPLNVNGRAVDGVPASNGYNGPRAQGGATE